MSTTLSFNQARFIQVLKEMMIRSPASRQRLIELCHPPHIFWNRFCMNLDRNPAAVVDPREYEDIVDTVTDDPLQWIVKHAEELIISRKISDERLLELSDTGNIFWHYFWQDLKLNPVGYHDDARINEEIQSTGIL